MFRGEGKEQEQTKFHKAHDISILILSCSTERVLPFISPKFPDPMARSLSFQSFDSSFSILGVSEWRGEKKCKQINMTVSTIELIKSLSAKNKANPILGPSS